MYMIQTISANNDDHKIMSFLFNAKLSCQA